MKKALKTSLLFVLSICMLLSVAFLSFSLTSSKAYADETQEIFQMEKGASIATTKDGLRFMVNMNGAVYQKLVTDDVENKKGLSVLIAPKSYYEELTDSEYINLRKCVKIDIDEEKIYSYNGLYHANVVLTNLNAENNPNITISQFDYDFIAVGCITDNSGAQPTYQYTTLNEGETLGDYARSQYSVIKTLVLEGTEELSSLLLSNESPYTWFATEEYPLVVENLNSYENLVARINAGVVFDGKIINISSAFDKAESSVQFDDGKTLPQSANTYHVITFKMTDGQEIVKTVVDGQTLTDIPALSEEDGYIFTWDKEIVDVPTESTVYTETKTAEPLPELEAPFLADFSVAGYASIVSGATAEVISDASEGSVMKVTFEVNNTWPTFTLNLPKTASGEKITVRFMMTSVPAGLTMNGTDGGMVYNVVSNVWGSEIVNANGTSLSISMYSGTAKSYEIYFSLVVDGEKTNEEMRGMKLFGNIPEGYLADFSIDKYASIVSGASAEVVSDTSEGSVMKVTLEVSGWTYFTLNLPKTPSEEKITIRFMVPTRTGGLEINGGDAYYSFTEGEWASYTRAVGNYGSAIKVGAYSGSTATFVIYFSLVVDGEKTNEEMRNMKLFGNIPEGYLADYSSETYESMITAGSWGTDIEAEYMPSYADETNVMKISATTKDDAYGNGGIRLFLPKASTTNKVTVRYMIDENYGIAGELHAVVKGDYTNKISVLPKDKGVWHQVEIDLTNQTEKDVVELYFWQAGGGVTAVMYVSFVYDGVLSNN